MIDFLKYRFICYVTSSVALAVGLGFFFVNGLKYHIDFAGGTELRLAFSKPIDIAALRKIVKNKGWTDAMIQSLGTDGMHYLVKIGLEYQNVEESFKKEIMPAFDDNVVAIESVDHVGAEAGREVKWNASVAIVLSMILLLLYLAFRMKYAYGIGAVVALAHDLIAVLLYLAVTGEPVSLNILAAVLAMLGYSINDTIVIFSRIKENLGLMRGATMIDIVNTSINQTLRRTILTSFATLLSVLALFILGGEALRGFSATMLIGIIVGTYSSIYIASPVMLAFSAAKN